MRSWLLREEVLFALGVLSLVTFLLSLVAVPLVVIRMRGDYFVRPRRAPVGFRARHPVVRLLVLAVKNLLGALLLAAGLAMLVLPGQGVLTILAGITLLNYPGKRRLELWLVRRPAIHRAIDWIRRRAGRAPLELGR